MKIITSASFYGSGSSALIDLLSEYDNVKSTGNYEFRLLHDLDGISDLEFHLIECHNRHNSGHALKRFYKLVKFYAGNVLSKRCKLLFGDSFLNISEQYINSLIDFSYNGWWFYDLYDCGIKTYYFKQAVNHFLAIFTRKRNNILKKTMTYCSHPSAEKFYDETKKYTHNLFVNANPENKEYLLLDQLVASQNINRFFNYFEDDVYVFVVDRDPRDIFLSEILVWKENVIPHNPYDFCKWYRYVRNSGSYFTANKNVIHIHFEDLIYNYDKTKKTIESFVGLNPENHINFFKSFNPKRSINNTQLWKNNSEYRKDIEIIESELKEFLYDFDNNRDNCIPGISPSKSIVF